MRTPNRMSRTLVSMLVVVAMAFALAACSGGGGGTTSSTSPGVAGPVSMNVALGGTDTQLTVSSPSSISPGTLAPATSASKFSRESFRHVYVYMTGVAFMPVEAGADIRPPDDVNGEEMVDGPGDSSNESIRYTFPEPVVFDLLNPPTARQVAKFLNKIEVPAGIYHKIRVYYGKVVVDGEIAHRTANGHLDIHFKAADAWDADDVHVDGRGYLVIPVAPDPADGVRLYCVAIRITGLKVHETGGGKIIIRPQVFAELARPVKYSIIGTADNVVHTTRSFDIKTSATRFPTVYHPFTQWAFDDNVFNPTAFDVAVDNTLGIAAFRTGAYVEAIGVFNTAVSPLTFRADRIYLTFPVAMEGEVDNGWNADNTFVLRLATDNVVFPKPGRYTAYYDNATSHAPMTQSAIDNNVPVKARGYAFDISGNPVGGIEAYWISIGP